MMRAGERRWRAKWWHQHWAAVAQALGYHLPGLCPGVPRTFLGAEGKEYPPERCAGCHPGVTSWNTLDDKQREHFLKIAETEESVDCDLAWNRRHNFLIKKGRRAASRTSSPYRSHGLHPSRALRGK